MVFGVGFKYNMTDLHSGAESASNRYRQLREVEDRRRGSPPRPLSRYAVLQTVTARLLPQLPGLIHGAALFAGGCSPAPPLWNSLS